MKAKDLGVSPQTPTNFLGQEISFGNRLRRRIYLCGSLKVGSKLLVKYREKSRYFEIKYKVTELKANSKAVPEM